MTGAGLDEGLDWAVKEVAGRLYWNGLASDSLSAVPEGTGAGQASAASASGAIAA